MFSPQKQLILAPEKKYPMHIVQQLLFIACAVAAIYLFAK